MLAEANTPDWLNFPVPHRGSASLTGGVKLRGDRWRVLTCVLVSGYDQPVRDPRRHLQSSPDLVEPEREQEHSTADSGHLCSAKTHVLLNIQGQRFCGGQRFPGQQKPSRTSIYTTFPTLTTEGKAVSTAPWLRSAGPRWFRPSCSTGPALKGGSTQAGGAQTASKRLLNKQQSQSGGMKLAAEFVEFKRLRIPT